MKLPAKLEVDLSLSWGGGSFRLLLTTTTTTTSLSIAASDRIALEGMWMH